MRNNQQIKSVSIMKQTNPMRLAVGLSLLLITLAIWPVRQNWTAKPKDSFPLSHYPMFSKDRGGKAEMTYLLGVDGMGKRRYLPYALAGTGGMNQVRKLILKRAKKDPVSLCQSVAKAVARSKDLAGSVRMVKIVESEFVFDRFFAGDQTPENTRILCSCAVNHPIVALNASQP